MITNDLPDNDSISYRPVPVAGVPDRFWSSRLVDVVRKVGTLGKRLHEHWI